MLYKLSVLSALSVYIFFLFCLYCPIWSICQNWQTFGENLARIMKCAQHVFFGQHVFSWSTFSNLVNLVQFGQRCDILWFGLVLYGLDGFECTPVCGEGQELLGQLKKQKMYLNRGS